MSKRQNKNQAVKSKPIYSFFSATKNTASVSSAGFYEQHLPKPTEEIPVAMQLERDEQIKNLKDQVAKLEIENTKLKDENKKCKDDLASLMKVHKETCRMYVNKELKVKLLEKKSTPLSKESILFESFKEDFGETVLQNLHKLHGSKRSDSTFILQCMRKLFENDKELSSISACGTDGTAMISIEKRTILENIFLERLSNEDLNDVETTERYIRLSRHINVAISNIRRANRAKKVATTINTVENVEPNAAESIAWKQNVVVNYILLIFYRKF